ncbi:hypothetical protein BDN72DRAFT_836281 [Pluteus cervinus]|uniref:Uncharacterized protein n=1 Tax=Pluteus cervinus TaxID=181527 RepID=A0ACD3B363_9AGAR|nr:hypothetical protein BDN72DRAFT_836281 [Pluteus cervinus]
MARVSIDVSKEDFFLYLIAILIPPLPVFAKRGFESPFWINLILCVLLWLPAIIHSWYVISRGTQSRWNIFKRRSETQRLLG